MQMIPYIVPVIVLAVYGYRMQQRTGQQKRLLAP